MSTQEIPSEDFKFIFKSAPGLYLIMSRDFTILEVSDEHLKATMTERKDVVGRKVFDVFPDNPDDPNATGVNNLKASLQRVIKNRQPDAMPVQKYDIARPLSQGGGFEERFWSIINAPILNEAGELVYIFNRVENVTELVQLQRIGKAHQELLFIHNKQVEESSRRLQDVNKELESFVYSVSHDLRAPLRAIHRLLDIIKENSSARMDTESTELFNMVCENATKMNQLIEDLLAFSRLGHQAVTLNTLDIKSLIEDVFNDIKRNNPDRDISLSVDLIEPINGDYALLKQVWVNLLLNAVKYTKPVPQAKIKISSQKNENEVIYKISDNGVGFDMKNVDKLFGVFQRLHSDQEFEGTGVGLAIVQKIIRRHNGRVWAEGKVGEGATFYIAIPC